MRRSFHLSAIAILLSSLALSACSPQMPSDLARDRDHETEKGFYLAGIQNQKDTDPVRSRLSQLFLVEQFTVGAHSSMSEAFKYNAPGGILFWNGNGADASAVREAVRAYSKQAQQAGLKPLLFSADYEGGALSLTPTGRKVPGVQRFVKGFTGLAHPRWLGVSMKKYGEELCQLHGKIMARELKSVGINYPLSVVADLATQSLTSVRGVSKDPDEVSLCLTHILDQFIQTKDMIFVTKHFPGLGQTQGDTHEGTVVAKVHDPETLKKHLKPFADLISLSSKKEATPTLSIMATHAKFLSYDPDKLTTESSKIIDGLLKQKLQFKGLVVSDAMWMGEYGTMDTKKLMPVYLNSFLSGMDLLMIPGSRFAQSIEYFRKVYDGRLSAEEIKLLTARTEMNWEETHQKLMKRLEESLGRQDEVRGSMKPAHLSLSDEQPTSTTTAERARYQEILNQLRAGSDVP